MYNVLSSLATCGRLGAGRDTTIQEKVENEV